MRRVLILVILPVCLLACRSSRETKNDVPIQLVEKTLLPDFEGAAHPMRSRFQVMIRVKPDGSVEEARNMNPIINAEWDAAAIDSIKKWRFTSFSSEDFPDGVVLQFPIKIEMIHESEIVTTGELWFASRAKADSIYDQLRAGRDFFDFVTSLQLDESIDVAFYQRTMEVGNYPRQAQKVVDRLRAEDFSKPVRVRDHYVIYRKMEEPVAHNHLLPNHL